MLAVRLFTPEPAEGELVGGETHEVDFVSLVNGESYGKPPLVTPEGNARPAARVGDKVLYINTSLVAAFTIERIRDRDPS